MAPIIGIFVGLLIGLALLFVLTLIFRWLWNTTVPELFGGKTVNLGQAFKIMLLSSILFGGGTTVVERGHEVVPDAEISDVD